MRIFGALLVVCALLLGSCKTPPKKEKQERAEAKKAAKKPLEESSDVDFQAFVGRLRKAAAARDMNTLASMMTTDFAYVMGTNETEDRKGEGVFKYWDEQGLWPELVGILSEKFVKKGEYMVAPPQFANPALNYDGYRAGVRRINGSWKFVYFVNG